MKHYKVKELMVPLAEYATVQLDATLHEAIMALDEAQNKFHKGKYSHRAILVTDPMNHVVGKLSMLDVLRALEPGYSRLGRVSELDVSGYSSDFIQTIQESLDLWNRPLDDVVNKASEVKVADVMYAPSEGEYVGEDTTMDGAIHQLVIGKHQSLLVVNGDQRVVGILRLADVFHEVVERIKSS